MKKVVLLLPWVFVAIAACSGGSSPTNPGGNGGGGGGGGGGTVDTILVNSSTFSPANLTVAPGRTVVWYNPGSVTHTVTPDGHNLWTTANTSSQGEVLRVTFSSTGQFNYYCEPHRSAGMTGRVTVSAN